MQAFESGSWGAPRCLQRTRARHLAALGLAALALAALAIGGASPGDAQAAQALVGATVITVSGAVHDPGVVVIGDDGAIAAVGPAASTTVPPGAVRIDLHGLRLYPGMIDAMTSLGLTEVAAVAATNDVGDIGDLNPHLRAYAAVNPDSELIPVARAGGITHALVAPGGALLRGTSGLIALDGWTWETMLVKGPVALHVGWPSMQLDRSPQAQIPIKKQLEQRAERLRHLDQLVDEARAYAQARATMGQKDTERHDEDLRYDAWGPVLRKEIPVMIHADGEREIGAALDWCARHDLRMVLAGGREADHVAPRLAHAGVPVIIDGVTGLPGRDTDPYDANYGLAGRLQAAGVKVAIASGAGAFAAAGVRNLPDLAGMSVAFGLPADAALRAVTLTPAEILGVAERMGSIEPGKQAHLIATDGDLLDIRTRVLRMWIGGKEVSLESRHTRLWEKYRARPAPPKAAGAARASARPDRTGRHALQ
jgi:imidazolonepropionase-like amidohydrolase